MRTLYFDCFSGISGDMTVAALLSLCGETQYLLENLKTLNLDGYSIEMKETQSSGISAVKFNVHIEHEHHKHAHHHHEHRGLSDILELIESSGITSGAKSRAKSIFTLLAKAEAAVHNTTVDEIHFHEVGAIDSIVDIVSTAVLLDIINPDRIISSPLFDGGSGFVHCAHGKIPVPVPAVVKIVECSGAPLMLTDEEGEMITPTGAAIICSQADGFTKPDDFKILKMGYGAGTKRFKRPNLLRVMLVKEADRIETVTVIETNIDDCTGEVLSLTREKLMDAGALDCWFEPIFMKKGRPAYKLCAIVNKNEIDRFAYVIFKETTAIGIRHYNACRTVMERESEQMDTEYGAVKVKHCKYKDIDRFYPEFESVKELSDKTGVPFAQIYMAAAQKSLHE